MLDEYAHQLREGLGLGDHEDAAAAGRPAGASQLIPYWIYEVPGRAMLERRVPMLPLSREAGRLGVLQRGIAVYRLAFGEPRQEDLLALFVASQGGTGADADADGEDGTQISFEPRGADP